MHSIGALAAGPRQALPVCSLLWKRGDFLLLADAVTPGLVFWRGGVQFAGEVTFSKADARIGVVGDADADAMHAGGRGAVGFGVGLEAEQIVVVDVVR